MLTNSQARDTSSFQVSHSNTIDTTEASMFDLPSGRLGLWEERKPKEICFSTYALSTGVIGRIHCNGGKLEVVSLSFLLLLFRTSV